MRVLFLSVLFVFGCGASAPPVGSFSQAPWNADPRGKEIVLGVGDVVGINVWDQKDLNTESTIRPDGTITMPLVGDLKAASQTPTALRDRIKAALANFVKLGGANEITVAVKTWKSYRFSLHGEISKPGLYTNDEYIKVADALALAGGPTRFAKRGEMVLSRTDAKGKVTSIILDYDMLASGKRPDMNIWILPGDSIWVP